MGAFKNYDGLLFASISRRFLRKSRRTAATTEDVGQLPIFFLTSRTIAPANKLHRSREQIVRMIFGFYFDCIRAFPLELQVKM